MGAGKRLRPILTLTTAETFGSSAEAALSTACALEMIHTYSLIHDDLPCMDDDDFRRGQPTLHRAFTEAHAVLAGDYLLTYAFEVIVNDPYLESDQKVAIIALVAKSSGGEGMIAGQIMDIEAEGKQIDIDAMRHIHRHKTGALISAAIECGGIIAGADPSQIATLKQVGADLGLAFQIIDDVIDVTESRQKHGKAVASDEANDKTTYVRLLGLEPARQNAEELLHKATEGLKKLDIDTSMLQALAERLVHREL
jgi:geranylgeranyl diphosphate synthase type II